MNDQSPATRKSVETSSAKAIKIIESRQQANTSGFLDHESQKGRMEGRQKKPSDTDRILNKTMSSDRSSHRSPKSAHSKAVPNKTEKMSSNAKIIQQIEEDFKQFKNLPKQKLHPFDFTHEELTEIKRHFPEFKPRKRSGKSTVSRWDGIQVEELMRILSEKIKIDKPSMARLISSLDHRNSDKVSWNEFLNFLTNEGIRRETVNDAQLYGFGVKRLE